VPVVEADRELVVDSPARTPPPTWQASEPTLPHIIMSAGW